MAILKSLLLLISNSSLALKSVNLYSLIQDSGVSIWDSPVGIVDEKRISIHAHDEDDTLES